MTLTQQQQQQDHDQEDLSHNHHHYDHNDNDDVRPWIRGVNLGGWLILERYITPYQFAITTCHMEGDLCWYPGQINAPSSFSHNDNDNNNNNNNNNTNNYNHDDDLLCDLYRCDPILIKNELLNDDNENQLDYPIDEYTLWKSFYDYNNTKAGEEWLNYHLYNFITQKDIMEIAKAGVTHIRIPLPHWILQTQEEIYNANEVWIVGQRWDAFRRVVQWAREYKLQIWPDVHTAPGSQNGFDNSGKQSSWITCQRWSSNHTYIKRSLTHIRQIVRQIKLENMNDVVTGFGLLNEPFKDCNYSSYLKFINDGLQIVRTHLNNDTTVYVSDLFQPHLFNDGHWWLNENIYNNTYLDTHYYHVFAETLRSLSPRQHIAKTCQNEYHHDVKNKVSKGGVATCCYQDPPRNTIPSKGVRHMVGEWSVAFDTLTGPYLDAIMQSIMTTGVALGMDREIPLSRQRFLRSFAEAQMVTYEMADKPGVGGAWFYWTAKMEGGAFAEWDFLRGIREGWIPRIPPSNVSSVSLYGTCYEIMARTDDNYTIIHEFPNPQTTKTWIGEPLDDDVVLSHGESILNPSEYHHEEHGRGFSFHWLFTSGFLWGSGILVMCFAVLLSSRKFRRYKVGYESLPQAVKN